jgi:hypothetical protein
MLPSPNLGTALGPPYILGGGQIAQVIEKSMVGDVGFEPAASTVFRVHKIPKKVTLI